MGTPGSKDPHRSLGKLDYRTHMNITLDYMTHTNITSDYMANMNFTIDYRTHKMIVYFQLR